MLVTMLCAFAAGFFIGNGAPYYVAGSLGEATNPSPFPNSPLVNVVVGWAGMLIGGLLGAYVWCARDPGRVAAVSAVAGVLAVGLIHARLWRANPWRKRD